MISKSIVRQLINRTRHAVSLLRNPPTPNDVARKSVLEIHPHNKIMNTQPSKNTVDDLRIRLQQLGWRLQELPIRSGGCDSPSIREYKLIALKNDRSITVRGTSLHDAMSNMCRTVGALPR